jgi:signal transduction histidine kinase
MAAVFASRDVNYTLEYRARHRDGRYLHLLDRCVISRDETGRAVREIGCMQDITEIRAAEAALKESDRRKDEFLATLAHELRNPLAPIRSGLELIRLAGDDSAAVQEAREIMTRQIGHLVRLIDDLLDVARITSGRFELRKRKVHLLDAIQDAVETSKPQIEALGHKFEISLPSEPVLLEGNRRAWRRCSPTCSTMPLSTPSRVERSVFTPAGTATSWW